MSKRIDNYIKGIMKQYPLAEINITKHTNYADGYSLKISTIDNTFGTLWDELYNGTLESEEKVISVLANILGGKLDLYYYAKIPQVCIDMFGCDKLFVVIGINKPQYINCKVTHITSDYLTIEFDTKPPMNVQLSDLRVSKENK